MSDLQVLGRWYSPRMMHPHPPMVSSSQEEYGMARVYFKQVMWECYRIRFITERPVNLSE
jgi:hypothetical protein